MSDYEDMTGAPIHVGDRLAVAQRAGNTPVLRTARVVGEASRGGVPVLKLTYDDLGSSPWQAQHGWIERYIATRRALVIN